VGSRLSDWLLLVARLAMWGAFLLLLLLLIPFSVHAEDLGVLENAV
jgi:hypothetical protein